MTKVLFVVDDFNGGAGNVVQLLAKHLSEINDYYIDILILEQRSNARYDFNKNINIICDNISGIKAQNNLIKLYKMIKRVKHHIRSVSPDVLISFISINNIMAALSMMNTKTPVIVSERTNPIYRYLEPYWRFLRFFAYYRANRIVVQAHDSVGFCYGRYKNKTVVIPNPILKPPIEKCYRTDKGANDCVNVISFGRLNHLKGFDMLIDSFLIAYKNNDKLRLTIYGEGPERGNLERKIEQLNLKDVIFLPGHTNDVYKIMSESDIYVLSSRIEGFPNALSEAMAVGMPVIAFDCHSGPKELIDNGNNGFLVEANNIEALAEKICILSRDSEMQSIFSYNAKDVCNRFSLDKVSNMWLDLIAEVTDK